MVMSVLSQHPSVSNRLDRLAIKNVILVLKFTSKQGERQVVIASRLKVIVVNVFPVTVAKLAIIAVRFINVPRSTVSPTMALVPRVATGSIVNTVIAIKLVLELLG
ncbi:MAG: hypothetical protein EZS28_046663 [Streblomastix strix]|uniref:Uncharacterized protein n=1 Tax=Streblomastix strix TaxID=222440 RepID=A0A5J4TJ10_9EUKA|nr:MAG: hypothetical protein EZS28_046663 [Streblomastix strix]